MEPYLTALGAYLLGSVSFAVVVSRIMGLPDPRSYGSKNPGATNVLRSGSKAAALVTLFGDAAKGWVAVWAAQQWLGADASTGIAAAALAVVLGHMYPVFHRFQGGKGVATSLGVLLALDGRIALGAAATFLILVAFFRYVSLGSMLGAVFAAFFAFFIYGIDPYAGAVLAIAILTVWRHRGNIAKLMAGTEGRLGQRKRG